MSMILTNNSTSTTLTAAGNIPLGNAVHGYGNGIKLVGNTIEVRGKGYFKIIATVNASITGTDAVTVSLYKDNNVLDSVTITPSAAGANVEYVIPWVIRKCCCDGTSILSLYISGGATITNVTTIVETERG